MSETVTRMRAVWSLAPISSAVAVLIVEEDIVTSQVLSACAQGCGLQIYTANTISRALTLLDDVDILVVQRTLPNGLGNTLLTRWQELGAGPCLFTVRDTECSNICRDLIVAGANHVLHRPIQPHVFLTYLRRYRNRVLETREIRQLRKELIWIRRWAMAVTVVVTVLVGYQFIMPLMRHLGGL